MDLDLRELERLAALGDETALARYLLALIRSGQLDNLEWQARLGDQQAVNYFLLALHYSEKINLDTFWVYPYTGNLYDGGGLVPVPLPFKIRMTINDIRDITIDSLGYSIATAIDEDDKKAIKGAFVVEDITLEMADKVTYDISNWVEIRWPALNINVDEEYARERLLEDIRYGIIRAGALLLIDDRGTIFPPVHELDSFPRGNQQSMGRYKRRAQNQNQFAEPSDVLEIPDPVKRRFLPHMSQFFPDLVGGDRQRYKIVLHVPSGRAYTNDRNYALLEKDVDSDVVLDAMRFHNQIDVGQKATTGEWQEPAWSRELPDSDFITYTVGT